MFSTPLVACFFAAGKLVIVNLQRTQHDKKAEASGGVVIRAKTDDVMRILMAKLQSPISPFIREDTVIVRHHLEKKKEYEDSGSAAKDLKVSIHSRHGAEAALPMVHSASFHFKGCEEPAVLHEPPFEVVQPVEKPEDAIVRIKLELKTAKDGENGSVSMVYTGASDVMGKNGKGRGTAKGEREWTFVSQVVHYHSDGQLEECGEAERSEKKPRIE